MDDRKIRSRALNNAYMLLRQRPRSEFEIRQRLKLKGYDNILTDDIISALKRSGDIDDAKFAGFWVESRMHSNPAGDIVLKRELKLKGVSGDIIEAALARKAGEYDENEVAFNMANEQFNRFKKLDKRKALKRVYDFLMRRGFAYETVQKVIDKIVNT